MKAILLRAAPWGMACLCLLVFALQTISLEGVVGSDADVFHEAVQRAIADPATLYRDERGIHETATSLQGFMYPPPSIAMLLPFGLGTPEQGHMLLSWAALAAAIGSIIAWLVMAERLGAASTNRAERAALVGMAVITGAVFTCRLGQVDTLILAIVTAGVWGAWQGGPRWGGAWLAFGSWIKIYPALLMVPLIAERTKRWPAIQGYAVAALLVLVAALLIFPLTAWRDFLTMLPVMAERTIVNIDNQSIAAVWARTTVPAEQAFDSYAAIPVPAWLRASVSIAAVAAVLAFVARARATGAPGLWVAAAVSAIISLVAPLGWGHSYAYVLPLLVLCLARAWRAQHWGALALGGGIWAALVIPSHRQFAMLPTDSVVWHVTHARYTIAAVTLLGLGWWLMRGRMQAEAAGI